MTTVDHPPAGQASSEVQHARAFPDDRLVLPRMLARWAGEQPTKEFVIEAASGKASTYAEVHAASLSWATLLREEGVGTGDTVVTLMGWRVESISVWCGIAALGAVDVTISPSTRGRMLVHQVNLSKASIVITDADGLHTLAEVRGDLAAVTRVVVIDSGTPVVDDAGFSLRTVPGDVLGSITTANPDYVENLHISAMRDVARLAFTSGTTGPSKAVVIPWGALVQGAVASLKDEYTADDRIYITSPANHVTGRMLVQMTGILGATAVLRPQFKTQSFWPDVHAYRCTMTTLVAAMADFVIQQPPAEHDADNPLKYLNLVPVHKRYEEFRSRFDVKVTSGYGMSEAVKLLSYGWDIEDPASCGRPAPGWPGLQLRIVDENDYEVPDEVPGQLVVRSDVPWTLNLGYFDNPEATTEVWRNGWFHTGDLFRRDSRGLYYFVDRMKDAIRRRGVNIASSDIEAEVAAHPEVRDCAAVGVKVSETEEEIKVFVVLHEHATISEAQLVDYVAQHASRHVVPRFVHFVDALPRNASEKVQKFTLRSASRVGEYDAHSAARRVSTR